MTTAEKIFMLAKQFKLDADLIHRAEALIDREDHLVDLEERLAIVLESREAEAAAARRRTA